MMLVGMMSCKIQVRVFFVPVFFFFFFFFFCEVFFWWCGASRRRGGKVLIERLEDQSRMKWCVKLLVISGTNAEYKKD